MSTISERVIGRVNRQAAEPDEPEELEDDIGELEIAEYVVFLLALETYTRYVEEHSEEGMEDDLIRKAVQLIKLADRRHLGAIREFLSANVPTASHRSVAQAFKFLPNSIGLNQRSRRLRQALTRGGASTMRAVFKSNKALQEIKAAMVASSIDDADAALDKFAAIPVRNPRLRKWIDIAAETAGAGTFQNAVSAASDEASTEVLPLMERRVQQQTAPVSAEVVDDDDGDRLLGIQQQAQETAQRVMAISGEPDVPPTRSEVIGIATAVAMSIAADPASSSQLKDVFTVGGYELDDEQKAAVVAGGRVLVAAGAGAGKSTTLVARLKYLLKIKKASPSRILSAVFNKKASEDLKEKVHQELGAAADAISIGTMHALFRGFIQGRGKQPAFGTPEERAMLSDGSLISRDDRRSKDDADFVVEGEGDFQSSPSRVKPPGPGQMTTAIRGIIKDLGPAGLARMTGLPAALFENNQEISAKGCKQYMENWRGNGVDFMSARVGSQTIEELFGSIWMELYYGIKGDLDKGGRAWEPAGSSAAFNRFMVKFRPAPDRKHLGDADDMIRIFRDILKRDPEARKTAQNLFDHILVDEAQDLNKVQHDIFNMMTENFDAAKGQSLFMVGDDKQSIYGFRGAVPQTFSNLSKPESNFGTYLIQTNYRCDPEIVEAANLLAQHNTGQIPMQAKASPAKAKGKASIKVETPVDYTDGAYDLISSFAKDKNVSGDSWKKFAVLSRTNAELNAFEDQCILHEIPYQRSKGKGFLESRESGVVMGYMDLAMSSDFKEMQDALILTISKPDRELFMSPDVLEKAIQGAFKEAAHASGVDVRNFNPLDFLTRPQMARKLAMSIKESTRSKRISDAKKLEARMGNQRWIQDKVRANGYEWMWVEDVEKLQANLIEMGRQVMDLRKAVQSGASTTEMLNKILDDVSVDVGYFNKKTQQDTRKRVTLKQQLKEDISFNRDPDEDDSTGNTIKTVVEDADGVRRIVEVDEATGEEIAAGAGLGTVRYLYQLAEPNDNDRALGVDPQKGSDFYRKIDRYKQISKELQDKDKYPDRLTLSTVHSVKGAQWKHTALCMSVGFFPPVFTAKVTSLEQELGKVGATIPWPPEQRQEAIASSHAHLDDDPLRQERNLAYVGITRAETDLTIICSQERVKRDNSPISMFVREAGLQVGQNVSPGVPAPAPEEVKTASAPWVHAHDDEALYPYLGESDSYGRPS